MREGGRSVEPVLRTTNVEGEEEKKRRKKKKRRRRLFVVVVFLLLRATEFRRRNGMKPNSNPNSGHRVCEQH